MFWKRVMRIQNFWHGMKNIPSSDQEKEMEERYNREPKERLKRTCIPTKLEDKRQVKWGQGKSTKPTEVSQHHPDEKVGVYMSPSYVSHAKKCACCQVVKKHPLWLVKFDFTRKRCCRYGGHQPSRGKLHFIFLLLCRIVTSMAESTCSNTNFKKNEERNFRDINLDLFRFIFIFMGVCIL